MSIDLSAYSAIQTALFTKLVIPGYNTLLLSNFNRNITIAGDVYTGIGSMLNITESTSEVKISQTEVSISISGIPQANMTGVLDYKIKGASIQVLRGIFNPITGQLLNIADNPLGKFKGIVNNYSIDETWSGQDASNTINLVCTSLVGLVKNKLAGRKTNPGDQKLYYPDDLSMDRVPNLANAKLNFGA
jgi:hypothetical protein